MGRGTPDRRRKPWRKERALVAPGTGDRIRQLREQLGLTQAQLGDGVLTGHYISALENGDVRPSAAAIDHIARRLGTTAVALGMISDTPQQTDPLTGLTRAFGIVRTITTTDAHAQRLVDHVEWVLSSACRDLMVPQEDLAPSAPTQSDRITAKDVRAKP